MLGELECRQICALVKDGARAEDVAREFGIEVGLVRLVAARNEVGTAEDRDISLEELGALRRHAFLLATQAESHAVQAQMTQFLIERAAPSKKDAPVSIITQINQVLTQADGRFSELAKAYKEVEAAS